MDNQDTEHAGKGGGWEITVRPSPLVIALGTENGSENKSLKLKQKSDSEEGHKSRRISRHIHQDLQFQDGGLSTRFFLLKTNKLLSQEWVAEAG